MIFSRIIYSAILVGFVAGVLLTSLQIASLNPIIFAAESYQLDTAETDMAGGGDGHSGHRHEHDGGSLGSRARTGKNRLLFAL